MITKTLLVLTGFIIANGPSAVICDERHHHYEHSKKHMSKKSWESKSKKSWESKSKKSKSKSDFDDKKKSPKHDKHSKGKKSKDLWEDDDDFGHDAPTTQEQGIEPETTASDPETPVVESGSTTEPVSSTESSSATTTEGTSTTSSASTTSNVQTKEIHVIETYDAVAI